MCSQSVVSQIMELPLAISRNCEISDGVPRVVELIVPAVMMPLLRNHR